MPHPIDRDEADRQLTALEAACHQVGRTLAAHKLPLTEDNLEAIAERIVDEVARTDEWAECFKDANLRALGYRHGVSAFSLAMRAICAGFNAASEGRAAA